MEKVEVIAVLMEVQKKQGMLTQGDIGWAFDKGRKDSETRKVKRLREKLKSAEDALDREVNSGYLD